MTALNLALVVLPQPQEIDPNVLARYWLDLLSANALPLILVLGVLQIGSQLSKLFCMALICCSSIANCCCLGLSLLRTLQPLAVVVNAAD